MTVMISITLGALVFGGYYPPVSRAFLLETVHPLATHPSP